MSTRGRPTNPPLIWFRNLTVSAYNTCKFVEHMIVHEVGRALGTGWPPNYHPKNSTLSVMSSGEYGGDKSYCEPQAYDILAIMANYQSR